METQTPRWRSNLVSLSLASSFALLLVGCGEMEGDVGVTEAVSDLVTTNGLVTVNGLKSVNGLDTANGLATANGLKSVNGLMTTDTGRTEIAYLVHCALPAGTSIVKQDQNGISY